MAAAALPTPSSLVRHCSCPPRAGSVRFRVGCALPWPSLPAGQSDRAARFKLGVLGVATYWCMVHNLEALSFATFAKLAHPSILAEVTGVEGLGPET
eukprot:890560-Rhodomonas_salina.2